MSKANWNTTDRVLFGIFYGVVGVAVLISGISQFIEACRSRPKVQMMVLSIKPPAQPGPDESSSAAE
ncbi:hypothetical protein ES702_07356 [subsurface metagenome]